MRDVAGPRQCSCQLVSHPVLMCSCCCKKSLTASRSRHEKALLERELARKRCSIATARQCQLQELEFKSQQLRERLQQLQKQCSAVAVHTANHAVKNDERRARLNPLAASIRDQLLRLDDALCEGSIKQAIESAREQVKILRFQWALKAFAMHRLDVRQEDADVDDFSDGQGQGRFPHGGTHASQQRRKEGRQRQARGVGKCGGLPLPNAGPTLYGVLPCQELQSCLRLVAVLTFSVASCLGIILPHPILLKPSNSHQQDDLIDAVQISVDFDEDALLSLLDTNSVRGSQGLSTSRHQGITTAVPPSLDPSLVSVRIFHATTAILLEADVSSTNTTSKVTPLSNSPASQSSMGQRLSSQYSLAADVMYQDEFAISLQLLQNNVIALCIRSGVPVQSLFPAEALLLNLHALQVFCEDQIKRYCQ